MSKKGNTIGQEFEDFLKVALTQQLKSPKKRAKIRRIFTSEELRELYSERGITEEMFHNYWIERGGDLGKINDLQMAVFHPEIEQPIKAISFQYLRDWCKRNEITEESLKDFYIRKGDSTLENISSLLNIIFRPSKEQLEWERSEEYQSLLASGSSPSSLVKGKL